MSTNVRIAPWLSGKSSMYAVERDGLCLPEDFLHSLSKYNTVHAHRLTRFMVHILHQEYISPLYLRQERPELGIFAMYNHKDIPSAPYNPSGLLCRFVGSSARILLVSSGFMKTRNEPIQQNRAANSEAMFLSELGRMLDQRIALGEVKIVGSLLVPTAPDSFSF